MTLARRYLIARWEQESLFTFITPASPDWYDWAIFSKILLTVGFLLIHPKRMNCWIPILLGNMRDILCLLIHFLFFLAEDDSPKIWRTTKYLS